VSPVACPECNSGASDGMPVYGLALHQNHLWRGKITPTTRPDGGQWPITPSRCGVTGPDTLGRRRPRCQAPNGAADPLTCWLWSF